MRSGNQMPKVAVDGVDEKGLAVLLIDLIYPRLDPRVTYVAENSGL